MIYTLSVNTGLPRTFVDVVLACFSGVAWHAAAGKTVHAIQTATMTTARVWSAVINVGST